MVKKKVFSARSLEAIHLLRALYRQTSCLFDDTARQVIKSQIRARFQTCRAVVSEQRQSQLLKLGRKVLSTLQRANDGHQWRMMKVLQYAYGHTGKRKHALLQPYTTCEATKPLIEGDPRTALPITDPKLQALIDAQQGRQYKLSTPIIPEKNVWNKPFSLRRKANILWRYRSWVLDKIIPPLPDDEYRRLYLLATGNASQPPPPRKEVIQQQPNLTEEFPETRKITKRYQRRMYTRIIKDTPKLVWLDESKKWSVSYHGGYGRSRLTTSGDPIEFEGVDSKGRIIRAPTDWLP